MHSPLPDATTLEAGIIEDSQPSRLSRVHDNVRNLLRLSIHGSVHSSPRIASPIASPRGVLTHPALWRDRQPEVLPSPSTESVSSVASTASADSTESKHSLRSTDLLLPPQGLNSMRRDVIHHSAIFDTRALAALNQPNLSDPSLAQMARADVQDAQRHAWKRSRHHRKSRRTTAPQWMICVVIGIALATLVATYIALATLSQPEPPVFHILFVLGILLVGIAFIHTVARLLLVPLYSSQHRHQQSRRRHRRHRRHHRTLPRQFPAITDEHFMPEDAVHVRTAEDVTLDPEEAQPSSAVHQPPEVWDRNVKNQIPNPPPAYGRWRGSVRADPQLLHWQAVSSPTGSEESMPSPTYEESQAHHLQESPPSYRTRESPARTRQGSGSATIVGTTPKPEMVEGRGIGVMESIQE